jgi:dipicolinate synthase subunit B
LQPQKLTLGFAMCGSFCTLNEAIEILKLLCQSYNVIPIMSPITYDTDTRFGTAKERILQVESATGNKVIHTVFDAEPIGPKKLLDALVIAPCTGHTLAKLNYGITDTAVTMAAKVHLRNARPLIIALATNDALSGSAKNIGSLLNYKNIYFVPFAQDDSKTKPTSCIADFSQIEKTIALALGGNQIQPII